MSRGAGVHPETRRRARQATWLQPVVMGFAPTPPERFATAAQLARFRRRQREFGQGLLDLQLASPAAVQAGNSVVAAHCTVRVLETVAASRLDERALLGLLERLLKAVTSAKARRVLGALSVGSRLRFREIIAEPPSKVHAFVTSHLPRALPESVRNTRRLGDPSGPVTWA